MEDKLVWISKRLSDISKDIERLSKIEKKDVINSAEMNSPLSLIEFFDSLNEYGKLY